MECLFKCKPSFPGKIDRRTAYEKETGSGTSSVAIENEELYY
jgi:hypothetical protein